MKKFGRYALLIIIGVGFIYTIYFLAQKSKQDPIIYETEQATYQDIIKQTLATGSIKPREEVDIKPQVSGIVQQLYVEAGEMVTEGQLIARVKVIPNMVSLNNAQNRMELAQINFNTAKLEYDRNKKLYEQEVIPIADFQQVELQYKNALAELKAAQDNLDIVKEGSSKDMGTQSLTLVKSTVNGMVLDVPIKVGNQVIESNNFNEGTTIATIANMNDMIFEGLIDESEVGKIKEGMDLLITIGAIENEQFQAKLEYIAPKGTEQNGAIQFQVRAKMELNEEFFVRAGYSANANIVLDKRDSVLTIPEGLLQFEGEQPFVEVATGDQQFEKREVQLGLSDGINVEVLDGIGGEDEIKVWNRAQF
jgi:HlyD family secretion protein